VRACHLCKIMYYTTSRKCTLFHAHARSSPRGLSKFLASRQVDRSHVSSPPHHATPIIPCHPSLTFPLQTRKETYTPDLPPLSHTCSKSLPSLQNSPSSPSLFKISTALSTHISGPPAPSVLSANPHLARCTSATHISRLQVGDAKRYKFSTRVAAVVC
jgi:hypothetical protein